MPAIIKSRQEIFSDDDIISIAPSTIPDDDSYQEAFPITLVDTSDLMGRSFLMSTPEGSQRLRVKTTKALHAR